MVVDAHIRGHTLRLLVKDPKEYLQSYWARGEIYEHDLFGSSRTRRAASWLLDHVRRRIDGRRRLGMLGWIATRYRGGTFLDVGSCIGNHALFFSVVCHAHEVISFEPVAELRAHQGELLALNDVTNVRIHGCALGAREGMVRIERSDPAHNAGMSTIREGSSGAEVPVRTLDAVLAEAPPRAPVRLVKVDVEGYNLEFLRGAVRTLEEHQPDLFIECETTAGRDQVAAFLKPLGYRLREDVVFNPTPTYLFEPSRGPRFR